MKTTQCIVLAMLPLFVSILASSGQVSTRYSMTVSNDAPILYWNFDGGSGDAEQQMPVFATPATNLNYLLPENGATRVSHASLSDNLNLGNAASLNGSNYFQAVSLSGLGKVTLTNAYAIELWMRSSTAPAGGEYLVNFSKNSPAIIYNYNSDYLELLGGGGRTGINGPVVNDEAWHHVMFVYYGDGTSGVANRVDAYLDGTNYQDIGAGMSASLTLNSSIMVGTPIKTNVGQQFQGNIDELAVYDLGALPDEASVTATVSAMVSNHIAAATSGTNYASVVLADHPILYWNFDEPSGNALQVAPLPPATNENALSIVASAAYSSHASIGSGLLLGDCADLNNGGSFQSIGALQGALPNGSNSLSAPWAVEMWFQVLGNPSSPTPEYLLDESDNNPAILYGYFGNDLEVYGNSGRSGTNGIPITDNKWHYLMVVNYGTAPASLSPGTNAVNRVDYFLDGVQYTNVGGGFNTPMNFGGAGLVFGAAAKGSGFDGRLDELAFYNLHAYTNVADIEAKVSEMAASHYAAAFADTNYGTIAITAQPTNITDEVGQTVTSMVSATVTGTTEPLTYLWLINGVAINGATNASFAKVLSLYDVGTNIYQVRLDAGPVHQLSNPVSLVVPIPPSPPPTAYDQAVIQSNPFLYWNFDEMTGPAIQQVLATNVYRTFVNDLVPGGSGISWVTHADLGDGLSNLVDAVSFQDAFSYFAVNPFQFLGENELTGPWAIEFWMQTPGINNAYIANFGKNSPAVIYGYSPNQLELFAGANGRTGTNGPVISDGNWHHVLWVNYDSAPAGSTNRVDVYLDGVLHTNVGGGFNSSINLGSLLIGAAKTTGASGYLGGLDEFAVYGLSGLDADQIQAKTQYMATNHYAVAHAINGPSYTATVLADHPLLYYNFNQMYSNAWQLAPVDLGPANNDLVASSGAGRVEHSALNDGFDLGNAADFNGASYYEASQLAVSDSVLQPPWAVGFWMQSLATNQDSYLINFGSNAPAFVYNTSATGTPGELDLFDGNYTASGAVVTDTNWHYVLWVNYGNASVGVADRVDVYLDGVDYSNVQSFFDTPSLDITHGLILGASGPGNNYFQGRLDELAVYDLSSLASENEVTMAVQQMVTNQLAAATATPPPALNFSASGGQLTLSWQGIGYVLQENTNLDNPSGWLDVGSSNSPVVITPASTGKKFYRLRSQ